MEKIKHIVQKMQYNMLRTRAIPGYRKKIKHHLKNDISVFEKYSKELNENGFIILPEYFSGDRLKKIKTVFEELLKEPCQFDDPEKEIQAIDRTLFHRSEEISDIGTDPFLLGLIECYTGRPVGLFEVLAYRTGSIDIEDYGAFQWHHDCKRKQVKIFMLLTDVSEETQHTKYATKTQKIFHKMTHYEETRFTDEEAQKHAEKYGGNIVIGGGKAGTVLIFDTNGIHRGTRALGGIRDHIAFYYSIPKSNEYTEYVNLHSSTQNKVPPIFKHVLGI